ncbi:MAG: hypothetical protein GY711_09635 [bacterium]|nr:hypothetical protein [bacterium]
MTPVSSAEASPAVATTAPVREASGSLVWRATGLSPNTLIMLFAVVLVVCIVSLPRLDAYALASNQRDARSTLGLFIERLLAAGATDPAPPGLVAAIDKSEWLRHRLRDARPTDQPGVVLHHGYYFALARSTRGVPTVYAWPRNQGRTGYEVYACGADGEILVQERPRAEWSGLFDPRELERVTPTAETGWVALSAE